MRLRNIKEAETKIYESPYIIEDYKNYKGKFNELFNNNNPIHLEIGMGKGNFIINNAINNPGINYIGVEKYASVMIRALEKLEDKKIDNLKLICFDASTIEEVFDKEIETLYLNFSDPWPKTRHEKRRLTSDTFLKKYTSIFKNKNHIIMKTDNRKLFEYSVISFNAEKYNIVDLSLNLYEDNPLNNIPTEYEIKFSSKGFPIYKIEVTK